MDIFYVHNSCNVYSCQGNEKNNASFHTTQKHAFWQRNTNMGNKYYPTLILCYHQIVIYTWFGLLMDYSFTVERFMHNMHGDTSYPMYTYCDRSFRKQINVIYHCFLSVVGIVPYLMKTLFIVFNFANVFYTDCHISCKQFLVRTWDN